ncbi:type II secretion system F family protein [Clostridium sp.]|uniref:type II secretion system F family protein n=1 Tax=Clostridium sp. TaxID=1506 RepID=UPI002633B4E2|nr:type II secretion system F family protein [Clostridium sp.]
MTNILKISKRVDYKNLSLLSGNMSRLLESGVNIIKVFEILIELPIRNQYKVSLLEIKELIKEGKSLEEAFSKHKEIYPKQFIGMLSIGEKNGTLSRTLKSLEVYYDKLSYIKTSIINSISYPIILLIAISFLLLFIIFFLIPNLDGFYNGLELEKPMIIRNTKSLVDFIKNKPVISLIYILIWGIIIPFSILKSINIKRFFKVFRKIKLIKDFNELIFIYTLNVIVKSGGNLTIGLQYSKESFINTPLSERFSRLNENILQGFSLYESFNKDDVYSNYTLSIIKISEEGGSIEEGLESLSKYLEINYLNGINKALSMIQPSLVILMGFLVVIFIMVFILPIVNSIFESGF